MRKVFALTRKEMEQYFSSPIAYIVVTLFLLLSGIFFYIYLNYYVASAPQAAQMGQDAMELSQAVMRPFFSNAAFFLVIILPMLTMRIMAEEKKLGTYELLMTSPLSIPQLILGKFLGVVSVMALIMALIGIYPLILSIFGNPDAGPILTGFLGLFLLGCAIVSLGILASSLTENQIVAVVLSFVLLIILWVINYLTQSEQWYGKVAQYIALYARFEDFTKGVLNVKDVFYYLSFCFFTLFVTGIVLQSQRWKA